MAARDLCWTRGRSALSLRMTCACLSVHKFPCQFPVETEFFSFDGKQWCSFHLPLRDAAGNDSVKGRGEEGWEEKGTEWQMFEAEIYARLRAGQPWNRLDDVDDNRADLQGVAFPHNFNFTGITEPLQVNFTDAAFGDNANFEDATFGDWASFDRATFGDSAHFGRVTFSRVAGFEGAKFGDYAFFNGATVGGNAVFSGATFGNGADFSNVTFQGVSDFSAGERRDAKPDFQYVGFYNTTFTDECTFENRSFVSPADFNDATFHDLVEFHGCTFHPGMSFHQAKFLKTKGWDDEATEKLERSYRTLKLEMEKLRARNEEADFFALEMECRRQRGTVPRLERFAATAYKHLSDYGRSIAKPLLWMAFLLGYSFAYFYHLAQAKSFHAPARVLRFVMEQITTPFSIWRNEYKFDPWMIEYLKEQPLLLRAPATLMTLMAITLAALFLLALRRRFKMD
ncbi:MAG: pentapeptide repeat-containing protein [Alphaproteobacteria bacterium]